MRVHGLAPAPVCPNAFAPMTAFGPTVGAASKVITGKASSGTVIRGAAGAVVSRASPSLPSMARPVPDPSTRAGLRETRLTPATNGRAAGSSSGSDPMVSETQPLISKKNRSIEPQTLPWT